MWSGPRNISTALMRTWENRPDIWVCDEPFYAHYLQQTHRPHPGAAQVIAAYETDWRKVADHLLADILDGRSIFYQKQMAHHMLPHVDVSWMAQVVNCFLIRDPSQMIRSLADRLSEVEVHDTGLPQQFRLFEAVRAQTRTIPVVLDASDVLQNPSGMLHSLCGSVGVDFRDGMLSGPRPTDGLWGDFWYENVRQSTTL